MSDHSKIEWTDATWNPVRGCTRVSEGCRNCYAEVMAARFSDAGQWGHGLARRVRLPDGPTDHRWTGKLMLAEQQMDLPLRWRKPKRIFVNSTSDLFHESVPEAWIDRVFTIMALCPQHRFQLLTKRPERARDYLTSPQTVGRLTAQYAESCRKLGRSCELQHYDDEIDGWRLFNLWLGTSIEDQATADGRIPHLLATPATVRFVSAEPLLGPVDIREIGIPASHGDPALTIDALSGSVELTHHIGETSECAQLDWVIVGGESGPGARPMHPDWARSLRDQCQETGVAFFFKQWGKWSAVYDRDRDDPDWRFCDVIVRRTPNGRWLNLAAGHGFHGDRVVRVAPVGKSRAGRMLDGQEWSQMPEDTQ